MSLNQTDIIGSVYVPGEGIVEIPPGYKVVKYGAVKHGDWERWNKQWIETIKVGQRAVSGTFMRSIR